MQVTFILYDSGNNMKSTTGGYVWGFFIQYLAGWIVY